MELSYYFYCNGFPVNYGVGLADKLTDKHFQLLLKLETWHLWYAYTYFSFVLKVFFGFLRMQT